MERPHDDSTPPPQRAKVPPLLTEKTLRLEIRAVLQVMRSSGAALKLMVDPADRALLSSQIKNWSERWTELKQQLDAHLTASKQDSKS